MLPIIPNCQAIVISSKTFPDLVWKMVHVRDYLGSNCWRVKYHNRSLKAPEHRLMRIDPGNPDFELNQELELITEDKQ